MGRGRASPAWAQTYSYSAVVTKLLRVLLVDRRVATLGRRSATVLSASDVKLMLADILSACPRHRRRQYLIQVACAIQRFISPELAVTVADQEPEPAGGRRGQ